MDRRNYKYVFVVGLHRSGTTPLYHMLSHSQKITGLRENGFPEIEGQYYQDVLPTEFDHGGAGKFAFDMSCHLTETSRFSTSELANKLFGQWFPYFIHPHRPFFLEKTPINIIRMKLLDSLFEDAYFISIWRHPISVSYATQKWSKTSLPNLFDHWIAARNIYEEDKKDIKNLLELNYEDFVSNPVNTLNEVAAFLGIESFPLNETISDKNPVYFDRWRNLVHHSSLIKSLYARYLQKKYSKQFAMFNYDFDL